MTVRVLYFAYFRERAGRASEEVAPPAHVATVAQLMDWLKGQGEGRERAFADPALVRVAVNREYVKVDHPIRPGDEVAFFPPVTGGKSACFIWSETSPPRKRGSMPPAQAGVDSRLRGNDEMNAPSGNGLLNA